MQVTSRTREQPTGAKPPDRRRDATDARAGAARQEAAEKPARTADDAPAGAVDLGNPPTGEEPGALEGLYARHTPDLGRNPVHRPALVAAALSHRRFARHRSAGQELVRIRPADPPPAGDGPAGTVVEIVTDDMPFLVESVLAAVRRAGGEVRRVIHPIVVVERTPDGELVDVLTTADPGAPPGGALVESWIHLDLAGAVPPGLDAEFVGVLREVRQVVGDGTAMARQARAVADRLLADRLLGTTPESAADVTPAADVAQLLRWLADGHFTFLGHRYHVLTDGSLEPQGDGLGILRRDAAASEAFAPPGPADTGPHELLVFTRASTPSRIVRPVQPYYVAVRILDGAGDVLGEHRFLGMPTVAALYENVLDIPVVERRVRGAIHRAGFPLDSYSGQQMLEVISALPREELFSATEQQLHDTAVGVLAVAGRRMVRLFLRPDPYRRFISCLVYLPRDRYTTSSRLAMAEVLRRRLGGSGVDHTARVSESTLALVHFTVHTDPLRPDLPPVDTEELQDELTEAVRTWDDRILSLPGGQDVADLLRGVPEAYKASVDPARALVDLGYVRALRGPGDFGLRLYAPSGAQEQRFTLYLAGAPATLTAVLPLLQHLGLEVLDERPSEIVRPDGLRCWTYDFGIRMDVATQAAVGDRSQAEVAAQFCAAFGAAWRGEAESDRFSALVLRAGLPWREVALLRAYARYARQLGIPYGVNYVAETLLAHPAVARALVELFHARFDPARDADRDSGIEKGLAAARELIDAVTGLDADRILRAGLELISATLRTNYYRGRPFFSFKLGSSGVSIMPEPRPRFEIYVYSPRVEGVHLRFGPVARGGLRWSDRPADYRTEILGLVKAQAVKNAVIVPAGAKGGFVVRRADAASDEVVACYRTFISGLLDVTDNLVNGETVPPPDVVRHDGDDSYLVVAADKGTAKFSDVANAVAADYGFWLGDAFASGGSMGYDHKAMGITARGAWESVKRHFRELGVDTQREDFTVVGVGDMSGDVFGNGMLLSRHIRLLAAFDHRHVFVDPDPDPERSFAERERLFALPRSSWDDYDRDAISAGGGVWPRTAKAVPIGPEIRAALGLDEGVRSLSPPDLIKAILRAPADLLWNGGIGTYVKAREESHADVGDKANDAVRVNAHTLRVKVVGEGGNLGLTQRGRIAFARAGGKINTDAIDNSAGVDCSDHEVNIKILLDGLVTSGEVDRDARNTLLAEMTDEVAELVLADNRGQNRLLGVGRAHAAEMIRVHRRFVADLEARRDLDRRLDVLPDHAGFKALEAAGQGLSSPELAALVAHAKLDLADAVLASDLPDTPAFRDRLPEYFPRPLRERFADAIAGHPLRREILTSMLVNEMVDAAGMTYAFRLGEEIVASPDDAVRAFAVATAVFDLPGLWRRLDDQDVPTAVSDQVVLASRRLLDRAARWFLTNRPQPLAVGAAIARFAGPVRGLRARLTELLVGRECEILTTSTAELEAAGVPSALAREAAGLLDAYGLLDVVELVELADREREPRDPYEVARLYYALSERLGISLALTAVSELERGDRWHALARLALRDDLYGSLREVTLDALREAAPGTPVDEAIAQWERANASRLLRARAALEQVFGGDRMDLATLSVVSRQLRGLAR
jgi:glutamate dehydrogenase